MDDVEIDRGDAIRLTHPRPLRCCSNGIEERWDLLDVQLVRGTYPAGPPARLTTASSCPACSRSIRDSLNQGDLCEASIREKELALLTFACSE